MMQSNTIKWYNQITDKMKYQKLKARHRNKLVYKDLVIGFPNWYFENHGLCDMFQKDKQIKVYIKSKNIVSTNSHLQLLHIDLFGSSKTMNFEGNYYNLVVMDY